MALREAIATCDLQLRACMNETCAGVSARCMPCASGGTAGLPGIALSFTSLQITMTILYCICAHAAHASGLVCVDVSPDGRALIGVGLDAQSRQLMVLWDISQLRFGGKVGGASQKPAHMHTPMLDVSMHGCVLTDQPFSSIK